MGLYQGESKIDMRKITIFLIIASVAVMACEGRFATPIKRIVENPRDYDGKTVTISGEVKDVFSLIVVKYFIVEDRTGEIAVITQRPLPKKGSKIRIRGEVSAAFSLGQAQAVVILEKENTK
jgi:hypothetical protein